MEEPVDDRIAPDRRRRRKRDLSIDRIVAAAVELADVDGLDAVSMARVADRLGFTPMALYRHVRSKDELVQQMFDAAVGEPPAYDGAGWRPGLEQWSSALLAVLERHPWTLQVPITGPPATPNRLAWLDRALEIQAGTGLAEPEKAAAVLLLNGHVFWWARIAREAGAGQDPDAPSAALADRFPAVRRALDAGLFDDDSDDFGWGLDRILDGIEQHVARRTPAVTRAAARPGRR